MMMVCLVAGHACAQTEKDNGQLEAETAQLTPMHLDNLFSGNVWDNNWFVSVGGGMSVFSGKPAGCGDFFDRERVMLNAYAGKWITPFVGGRIAFQGLKLTDAEKQARTYQNVHADFMYNIAAHFNKNREYHKWSFGPYLGTGLICIENVVPTRNKHNIPFAVSYGITGQYRMTKRFFVAAEIGNTMTWQSFDGYGEDNKIGDHLLQASVGIGITLGKVGWKRVVDPMPYMEQNDILIERLAQLKEANQKLDKIHKKESMALAEMKKILEIEGLLDKYNLIIDDDDFGNDKVNPKNNYSGLNSLRARLRNRTWNGDSENYTPMLKTDSIGTEMDSIAVDSEKYFHLMKDGKIFVGSPIFFFFRLNSDKLTEQTQLINIRQVANTVKKYGMCIRIVGAADSQTGTAYINEKLSAKRAAYIAKVMLEEGVPEERIQTQYRGGINTYVPQEGNRNTCVMLYFK